MVQNYFSFQGRLNRKPYWLRLLILTLIYFVGAFALAFLGAMLGLGQIAAMLIIPLALALFVSSLSLGARRLHDRGKSAWWLLAYYVAPAVLMGIAAMLLIPSDPTAIADPENPLAGVEFNPISVALYLAGIAISLWALIDIGFLKGTTGDNQYGPDPLSGQQ